MKKKLFAVILTLALACVAVGCGKKEDDTKTKIQKDIVTFVNESLPAISADRDVAIAIYNTYFTAEDIDLQSFLGELQETAIPYMEIYIVNLTAVETQTDEVAALKDLYLQCAQKQCDAMKMVASAIEEENPEFLTQAEAMITEATSYLNQYESELRLLAIDNDITINGTFNSSPDTSADQGASDTTGNAGIIE